MDRKTTKKTFTRDELIKAVQVYEALRLSKDKPVSTKVTFTEKTIRFSEEVLITYPEVVITRE